MKVDVYFNIRTGWLSIRSREKETYGRVVKWVKSILLKNCKFVVSEAGRKRVLREKRKNVHAVVRGETTESYESILVSLDDGVPVTYNPYRNPTFVRIEDSNPIYESEFVFINGKPAWFLNQFWITSKPIYQ